VDVLYSLYVAENCYNGEINVDKIPEKWINQEIEKLGNHFEFYWENAGLVVRFNDLVQGKKWNKILPFLDLDYNPEKIQRISQEYSKEKIVQEYNENQWMNPRILSNEYKEKRKEFREKYGKKILNKLSDKLNKEVEFLKQEV
jgi:hypothetical protein